MNSPKTEDPLPTLLTIQELAQILKISPRSIWRLVSAGKLIPPLHIGGSIRWRQQDIKAWVESGCEDHNPKPR